MTRVSPPDWPSHGGRRAPLLARFGLPREHPLIDFSANLNPLGPPAWLGDWLGAAAGRLADYPDPDDDRARRAIAAREGLTPEQVLVTNGGAEAIYLAAALHAGGRALVVEPTFGEYRRACDHYGLLVVSLALRGEAFRFDVAAAERALAEVDVAFLCRPNNPTGTLVPREAIERLLARGRETGTTLVVDEAFVDFTDGDERLTPLLAGAPNLLLLRSLTKLFDLPGLRLGYLLGAPALLRGARARQMPWSVNALALGLVAPLLADADYLARTRDWLAGQRPAMPEAVRELGYDVPATQASYFLLRGGRRAAEAEALFAFLLRRGLLARHTHNFPGLDGRWLRLALRDGPDNARLLAALAEWRRP
ncbi:threonine-phosphate decarboxylase CobD [Halomonas stenophila]|uniref:threonine-phosphate decarboxylase n=1 Tax=Halomonas stenophila TaxID=795312 RepID=A0A7W5EXR9_9GAMM|nr:threonine-phosphate decarboxylase CobD [Halomonas stenophila]MBB3232651.1 threonine-phosphate decarboxylase [Halomonas stenophila]